jgi:predicted PurR-regulated permease PerM
MDSLITAGSAAIGKTIITVGGALVLLILIPVYIFLLLFYQPLIIEFIYRLSGLENREQVSQILSQIKILIQDYLVGLLIQAGVIAILYLTGLLILGIDYAILLAVSGAFLNMIPYIGAIIAAMLPMLMAVVTKPSPASALLVLGLYVFIQFIDNNILVPRIVASKVRLNALTSIIVVFSFGLLWGIPGMFLSIPLTAIIKVICDHIEPLKPLGFLLGDTMPEDEKSD